MVRIDVSTRAAVVQYLRSIHVDPTGVVIQRGTRNYAGLNCPGKGWSCTTTAHPVVQVASAGGANAFSCSTASCAVVQVAPNAATINTAKCIKTSGLSQSCAISQSSSSGNNVAIVYEDATKASGLTQTASSTASITQKATGSGMNTACVKQNISIDGSTVAKKGTPVNVTLEAHQTVTIKQDSGSGGNFAAQSANSGGGCTGTALAQSQTLTSTASGRGPITQNENKANSGANMTIDIEQNQSLGFFGSASGQNSAVFNQSNTLTAVASTPAGPISQTQSSVNGGLLGTINQDSRDQSTATATQTETQCEDATKTVLPSCDAAGDPDASQAPSSLTQIQYGPVHKGVGTATQTGNGSDSFTINQTSTQDDDQGIGSQQTNVVQGDCKTSGTCRVDQTTSVDGTTTTNTQTGQNVSTSINCTSSACTAPPPGITFDGSPGTGSPPPTLGPYNMTAFGPDSQLACPDEGSSVTGVTDPAGAITFDQALRHDHVGTCWATWSNGYTGDVYDTIGSGVPTQVTITLPVGTNAFYFYAEPNVFDTFTIQATAQDGTSSGLVDVQGNSGAQFFGFYGTGGDTVQSITVTTSDSSGFAVGEFGINTSQIIG